MKFSLHKIKVCFFECESKANVCVTVCVQNENTPMQGSLCAQCIYCDVFCVLTSHNTTCSLFGSTKVCLTVSTVSGWVNFPGLLHYLSTWAFALSQQWNSGQLTQPAVPSWWTAFFSLLPLGSPPPPYFGNRSGCESVTKTFFIPASPIFVYCLLFKHII